jgi:hypothetical protein
MTIEAEHCYVVKFYGQPLEKINECFETLRLVTPGLVHWASRPFGDTQAPPGYAGVDDRECLLIFISAAARDAFEVNERAKEIYALYRSAYNLKRSPTVDVVC